MRLKKYLGTPYVLLLLLSLIMAVNSFFIKGTSYIIQHDTYFVIGNDFVNEAFALILLGTWIIYIVADTVLSSGSLAKLHIYSFALFFGLFLIIDWIGWPKHRIGQSSVTYQELSKPQFGSEDILYALMLMLLLVSWSGFVVNMIMGITGLIKRLVRNK